MPPAKPSRAVIGDLHTLDCRLVIRCKACGHRVQFTPSEAVSRFGWNRKVADMRPRLTCARCGATARAGKVEMGLDAEDRAAMDRREGLAADHPEDVKDRSPGRRKGAAHRMKWQGSLGDMLAAGTILKASCEKCGAYRCLDVAQMVDAFGPETDIWDRWAVCPACGGRVFFMATTSHSTPTRPCITSGDPNHWTPLPMQGLEFIRNAPEG